MLENLRRKFSHQKHKVFYDKFWNLGMFEDLVYYNDVGYPLPIVRAMKKASAKSFGYIYQTSQSVKLKDVGFLMLECPAGTFIMGPADQENTPPRSEVIETSFLLGQTEVTQELYEAVMGNNPSKFKNSLQNPVEQVSWFDALEFCNKLSELQGLGKCYTISNKSTIDKFGKDYKRTISAEVIWNKNASGYRLPTEKEWEYAAKAGTQNEYAGTDDGDELGEYAVYARTNSSTQPVGSKDPNEWGFHDMSGNVEEWCWDKYDPDGDASFARVVIRGGSWFRDASYLRSAFRYGAPLGYRLNDLGFRVCRTLV